MTRPNRPTPKKKPAAKPAPSPFELLSRLEHQQLLSLPPVAEAIDRAQAQADAVVEEANRQIAALEEKLRVSESNLSVALQHAENLRKDLADSREEAAEAHRLMRRQEVIDSSKLEPARLDPVLEVELAHELLDSMPGGAPPRRALVPSESDGSRKVETTLTLAQRLTRLRF